MERVSGFSGVVSRSRLTFSYLRRLEPDGPPFRQSKGTLEWDDSLACFRPDASMQRNQAVVGAANGTFGLSSVLVEAHAAALAAADAAGFSTGAKLPPRRRVWRSEISCRCERSTWSPPSSRLGRGKHFVDQQHDVTAADLLLAVREGYRSIEHVKRYTTTGMATDQGKTSNVAAIGIVAEHLGKTVPEVGVTTFRHLYRGDLRGLRRTRRRRLSGSGAHDADACLA